MGVHGAHQFRVYFRLMHHDPDQDKTLTKGV